MKKHNARKKKIAAKKAKQATQMQKTNRGFIIPCPEGVISVDFPGFDATIKIPGSMEAMEILNDTLKNMVFDGPQRGSRELAMLAMALYEKGLFPVIKIGKCDMFFKNGKLVIC